MTTTRPVWYWCVLGAIAMSLGWALRGSIGGGFQTFAPLSLAWTLVVATTAVVAVSVARYPRTRAMLLLVTWTAVASAFRYFLPPSVVGRETVTMLAVFVFLALVLSALLPDTTGSKGR